MSTMTARRASTETVVDSNRVPPEIDSDESEDDDLNSDYEAFMQEVNDIVAEFGSSNDDDELDQYVDQLENELQEEETDNSEQSNQRVHPNIGDRILPSTQPRDSVFGANGFHARTNDDLLATSSAIDGQREMYADHLALEHTPSLTDYLVLAEEAELRANEEHRLRMQLERNFREEKAQLDAHIDQLHAENQTMNERIKQILLELSSTQEERNAYGQRLHGQTKELEELVADKNCLTAKLREMQENSVPLYKAKYLFDENKRLSVDLETMKRRAVEAEVGIYVLKQRYETDGLKRSLNDVEMTLENLRKIIDDISALARTDAEKADVREFLHAERLWINIQEEMSRMLREATGEFERYIGMIRGGTRLVDLPPIRIPNRPNPPVTPKWPDWVAERRLELQRSANQPTSASQSSTAGVTSPPPGFDFAQCPIHSNQPPTAAMASTGPLSNGQPGAHRSSAVSAGAVCCCSQQSMGPPKPRTQALFDGVAALVPNTTRNEIADAIHKARENLPQGFRSLGLTGAIQRVADTVKQERLLREQQEQQQAAEVRPAPPSRRTVTHPQPVRIITGHQQPSTAEIASATLSARKEIAPATPVETAAEKVSFFDAPKDDDCTICHEPFRRQVDLERCRVCHTVFHHSCLKTWLRLKKTCPICNRHMLLDEEFPAL